MRPLKLDDVAVGQYKSHTRGGVNYPGYTDDITVPKGSLTPTFAAAALFVDNARWDGVPFLMKAGKALHTRSAEIRVHLGMYLEICTIEHLGQILMKQPMSLLSGFS